MLTPRHSSPQHPVHVLYSDHHGWLLAWLRKRLGNAGDAADLAQDTFVRVMGKTAELPTLREPRAWLTSIAHGLVVDHVRRQDIERAYEEVLASESASCHVSPEIRLMALEALYALDVLLEGLKPNVRLAFLMSRLEEMSYPDIARRLQVSLSSVEKYMATAIRHCYEFRRMHASGS